MSTTDIIKAAVGVVLFGVCLVGYVVSRKKITGEALTKKQKRVKKLWFIGMLITGWFTGGAVIAGLSGKHSELKIHFEMFSERVKLPGLGFGLARTTIIGMGVLVMLIVLAVMLPIMQMSQLVK